MALKKKTGDPMKGTEDMLDMNEFAGETTVIQRTLPPAVVAEDDSYEAVLARLSQAEQHSWICIPAPEGRFTVRTIEDATPEEFYEWVTTIYPLSGNKNLVEWKGHSPTDYRTKTARANAFWQVLQRVALLKQDRPAKKSP